MGTKTATVVAEEFEEPKRGRFLWWEFETEIKWPAVIYLTAINAMAVYALLTHDFVNKPWSTIYVAIWSFIGGFGITGGAHRYFTHRSYKATLPLRIILIFIFSSAGQIPLLDWVRDHAVHHKYSDTSADPHNARRGFFFSHIGWLMLRKRPEVIKKGKALDLSYLYEDPLVEFHDRHFFWLKLLTCYAITMAVPVYLMGETWTVAFLNAVFRQVAVMHLTFSINSFAHLCGTKPYDTRIMPGENKFHSFFAMGEAFHNYHHTFPYDYRTHEGRYFSVTSTILDMFAKIGWAYDLRTPSRKTVETIAKKHGDGTFIDWGRYVSEGGEE